MFQKKLDLVKVVCKYRRKSWTMRYFVTSLLLMLGGCSLLLPYAISVNMHSPIFFFITYYLPTLYILLCQIKLQTQWGSEFTSMFPNAFSSIALWLWAGQLWPFSLEDLLVISCQVDVCSTFNVTRCSLSALSNCPECWEYFCSGLHNYNRQSYTSSWSKRYKDTEETIVVNS